MFKRFVLIIFTLVNIIPAHAETISMQWLNEDGSVYTTSTCESGGDVILPQTPTKTGYTFMGWKMAYTPVEYLESTGSQYIDTGIVADHTTEAELEFEDLSKDGVPFMASNGGWSSKNFGINMGGAQDKILVYMNCDGTTNEVPVTSGNIKLLLTGLYLNNERLSVSGCSIPSSSSFNTNYSVRLFGAVMSGSGWNVKMKAKYFKLWKNSVIVRDFIPVIDMRSVPCMYDKVSETCFYNQGTGQFIAGPEIQ